MRQAGREIAGAEGHQFLIGVDVVPVPPREALCRQHATGKADQRDAGRIAKEVLKLCEIERRQSQRRKSRGHGPQDGNPSVLKRQDRDRDDADGHDDQGAGQPRRQTLQHDEENQQTGAHDQGRWVRGVEALDELRHLREKSAGFAREAEQLRQLANQDDQGDAIQIADENGLREEVGDEAQTRDPRNDVEEAGHQRQCNHQGHVALRIVTSDRPDTRGSVRYPG